MPRMEHFKPVLPNGYIMRQERLNVFEFTHSFSVHETTKSFSHYSLANSIDWSPTDSILYNLESSFVFYADSNKSSKAVLGHILSPH